MPPSSFIIIIYSILEFFTFNLYYLYSSTNLYYLYSSTRLFISVLVVTFISSTIFIAAIFVILYCFNMKGQQRIEKKLNEEDKQD
ncbi:DUF6773 family protein [Clostridium algidicarnis]|uniref:DUF6773 family protein n=1 Tax=Clostridium algidicarnis TaxID=37659 RepID=UPI00339701AE